LAIFEKFGVFELCHQDPNTIFIFEYSTTALDIIPPNDLKLTEMTIPEICTFKKINYAI